MSLEKLIESFEKKPPDAREVELVLKALQWHEDMVVLNDFNERVWLKPCLDASGKRIGITDCCFESEPCERHARIAQLESKNSE